MSVTAALGFVEALRGAGLVVPPGSARLFTDALAEVDLADPSDVYWAARATLVHRAEDREIFDHLFVAYWGGATPALVWRPPGNPLPVTLAVSLALSVGLSRMHRDDLAQLDAGLGLYDALYRWARDGFEESHDWTE